MGSLFANVLEGRRDLPFRPEMIRSRDSKLGIHECSGRRFVLGRYPSSQQRKGPAKSVGKLFAAYRTGLGSERRRPDDGPVLVRNIPRLSGILQVPIGEVFTALDQ